MKILLTGANGFVGSHVLDRLCAAGHAPRILLRATSDTAFIRDRLPAVETVRGDISDAASLREAMRGVDAVIHCAGKTKVVRVAEYYRVNEQGARHVVQAANDARATVAHFIHISSLAANRPGTPEAPALETDAPAPVSDYGRSKLLAEECVRQNCAAPWTILRPAAVFGPRDRDFLSLFRAVRRGIMPLVGGGRLPLSLAYVEDVADAAVQCLGNRAAIGQTYHVAAEPPTSARAFMLQIAAAMNKRPIRLPVPLAALVPVALVGELLAVLTRKPGILSRQKIAEMRVPGWVCSTAAIHRDLGLADIPLPEALKRTIAWYEQAGWI